MIRAGLLTAALLLDVGSLAPALAQDTFPSRPIQVVITSTAGSTSDVLTRMLSPELSRDLGQPIVVVAKPSATGTIGADFARRAAPDGYTLFLGGNTTMAANVHLVKNLNYDPIRDFEPISQVTINPLLLVVRSNLPIRSVTDLIAYAKARPGQLNYGFGNSGGKIAVDLLKSMAGFDAQEVAFKGASQALLDVVGGRLEFMVVDPVVADPHVRSGALRALAITSTQRLPSMPDIAPMAEAGVAGYDYASFLGYYAPKGTLPAVVQRLNQAFVRAIASKEAQDFFARMGMIGLSSTPAQLRTFNEQQIENWGRLVRIAKLEPQ